MCGGRVGQGARSHPAAFPDGVSLESEHARADFRYIYSPNYREGVFSESGLPVYGILGNPICATTYSGKPYI
jgi:hypothetical protein